jgi:hypothetical protein
MWAGIGYLVICPDHMACSNFRKRELSPLATKASDMDYWSGNLLYESATTGAYTYNTAVDGVFSDPDYYKKLYEIVFKERSKELHFVLSHLPKFCGSMGVFIAGTSEGAMTVARFDDKSFGTLINGRIISAFSVEYCYFTPTEAAAEFGGATDIPTLQLIGDCDEYFGIKDSIAQLIAQDPTTGYGNKDSKGHAFETMKRQGMEFGC